MKLKSLSDLGAFLLLSTSALAGDFSWPKEGDDHPPGLELTEEKPGVRNIKSLKFANESQPDSPEGRAPVQNWRITGLPLVEVSNELTVACFVFPERRKANEDFIASKSDSRTDANGYRLFKVWNQWGLEVGDGTESKRLYAATKLMMKTWQHLAVVVKDGTVTFYHDGIPAGQHQLNFQSVKIPRSAVIGSGLNNYLSFHGYMTGIYLSDTAVDENTISSLMRQVTE